MNTTADLTTQTPVEIDTALAELWYAEARVKGYLASEAAILERKTKQRSAQIAAGQQTPRLDRELAEGAERMEGYEAELAESRAVARPYEAEYRRRGGWSRYYLAKSHDGHVHTSMGCSTCYPTTLFGWLVDLAAKTQDEMIEQYGATVCTVCVPDAPTHPAWERSIRKSEEEKLLARAAALGARQARLQKKIDSATTRLNRAVAKLTKLAPQRAALGWVYDPATVTHEDALAVADGMDARRAVDPDGAVYYAAYDADNARDDLRRAENGLAYFLRTGRLP